MTAAKELGTSHNNLSSIPWLIFRWSTNFVLNLPSKQIPWTRIPTAFHQMAVLRLFSVFRASRLVPVILRGTEISCSLRKLHQLIQNIVFQLQLHTVDKPLNCSLRGIPARKLEDHDCGVQEYHDGVHVHQMKYQPTTWLLVIPAQCSSCPQ